MDGAAEPIVPTPAAAQTGWSFPKRFAFRFGLTFFVVFSVVFAGFFPISLALQTIEWTLGKIDLAYSKLVDVEPGSGPTAAPVRAFANFQGEASEHVFAPVSKAWAELVGQVGERVIRPIFPDVLGPDERVEDTPSGSGDTIFDWTQFLTTSLIALLVTILWCAISRRRRAHPLLAEWLWVGARIFLAGVMFGYGFAKVVKTQFSEPPFLMLLRPLGDMSPLNLIWTFMGYSTAYTVFAGAGEVLGGVLLCFRRTATLGALVVIGVMANVTMMNFCYDVPVKLYAAYYLALAVLITLPDCSRLLNLFVLNRPSPARDLRGPFRVPFLDGCATFCVLLWMAATASANIEFALHRYHETGDGRALPPLYGVYEVETFTKDGVEVPPLLTDGERWRRWIVDYPGFALVQTMTGVNRWLKFVPDVAAGTIVLSAGERPRLGRPPTPADPNAEKPAEYTLAFHEDEPGIVTLNGDFEGHAITVRAKRKSKPDFPLMNRGFRWVSPDPYNR